MVPARDAHHRVPENLKARDASVAGPEALLNVDDPRHCLLQLLLPLFQLGFPLGTARALRGHVLRDLDELGDLQAKLLGSFERGFSLVVACLAHPSWRGWLQPTQLEDEDAKKGRTVFLGYWETEQKALDIYQEALKAREAGKPLPKHLLRTKTLTSKHFGVSLVKRTGKFTAAIRCDGKQHYVGTYTNEDDAKKADDRAAEQIKETVRADQIICRSIPVACSPRRVLLTVPGCRDRASSRATQNRRSRSTVA